jgi:hypothetical protein
MSKHQIEVKNQNESFRVVATIARTPRQHAGWQSVRYQGKRYQLFGGVRVNEFIDVANPLRTAARKVSE